MITDAKHPGNPSFHPSSYSEGTTRARHLHKEYERKLSIQWKLLMTPLFFPNRHASLKIELADCKLSIKLLGGHS